MSKKIKWGILGCGKIANKFARDLKLVGDAELAAIASRNAEKLATFSGEFRPAQAFDTYEALVECADVEAIYVATPHGMHYDHVMLCLRNGKAVLCEKAFFSFLPLLNTTTSVKNNRKNVRRIFVRR